MTAIITLRMAWAEAIANRASFWTQVGIMATNDLMWVVFWVLFFDEVGSLRGWDRDGVLVLFALFATAVGLTLGLFANSRRIGMLVRTGALDAVLTLPTPPLRHLLLRRVEVINLGDVVFGLGLFAVIGSPTPTRAAVFALGVAASTAICIGYFITVSSLSLFGLGEDSSNLGVSALLILANYPIDIFGGATRVIVFSVVPAAFVSAVPARLVLEPSVTGMAVLTGVACAALAIGTATFHAGLRRYTSSSTFTRG